ncbi:lipoyl synthase [Phaeovibrio sulfidiphilus]|uniref:Lipoyl synthase n=1 Tax=Phaeovibrio sulfidiphilus TaxID=1220600 RepID=A0A8J6YUX0_9PROT|nr:lipoyl synthase [Phaeovibrio sulfidiphilus]MBE1236869.1 lipoyl synthase [Phaeovibrio sulfidiphilus]
MSEPRSACQQESASPGAAEPAFPGRGPKPAWLKVRAPVSTVSAAALERDLRARALHTVCEAAACPNRGECWSRRHASFMILGDLCTRACRFCNVRTARPHAVDPDEPDRLADTVQNLGLSHVVITSVTRDDLPDGGAAHFAACVHAVRRESPECSIEVLTPDFRDKPGALETVLEAQPDVFNHNMETVPRLYPTVRPGATYARSLDLLRAAKALRPSGFTKSGLMAGLGETPDEICAVMDDLREADVDFLTIGQYLQPTKAHIEVERYVTPEEFDTWAELARNRGFLVVQSTPLTRSSHHADRAYRLLKAARLAQQEQG